MYESIPLQVEIFQLRANFQTVMILCSQFDRSQILMTKIEDALNSQLIDY